MLWMLIYINCRRCPRDRDRFEISAVVQQIRGGILCGFFVACL